MTIEEQELKIYEAYPRKVGRRSALRAIRKAVGRLLKSKASPDEESARRYLWRQATLYSRSPAGQRPPNPENDFRPHPSTFFNQDRFLDDPKEWLKPNGASNGRPNSTGPTKSDRTSANLRSLLDGESNANSKSSRSRGGDEGCGGVDDLFAFDGGQIIEGTS